MEDECKSYSSWVSGGNWCLNFVYGKIHGLQNSLHIHLIVIIKGQIDTLFPVRTSCFGKHPCYLYSHS